MPTVLWRASRSGSRARSITRRTPTSPKRSQPSRAETATSASFDFSFHYDKDPITAGVQDATAGGTLVFDKAADTYTFTMTDAIDGFSFDVLHTERAVAEAADRQHGPPEDRRGATDAERRSGSASSCSSRRTRTTKQIGFGFNSTGDWSTDGRRHDVQPPVQISSPTTNEDWVSATQSTNGVAGDTIQKGELLTLRFFEENILGDVDPSIDARASTRPRPPVASSSSSTASATPRT